MGAQKQSCRKMHACKHDAHVTLFFRAARMPKAHEHHLKASFHLMSTPKCSNFAWSLWHTVLIDTCPLFVSWYFNNFPNSSYSINFHSSNSQIISKLSFSNNFSKFQFLSNLISKTPIPKFNFKNFYFQIIVQNSNFQIFLKLQFLNLIFKSPFSFKINFQKLQF